MTCSKVTGNVLLTEEAMDELSVQLQAYANESRYHHEGDLGVAAVKAWQYYYGDLPEPTTNSSSSWVDRTVWESCNGALQELMNVFTSGEDAVRFSPRSTEDALGAEAADKLVNKAILTDNLGYRVLHDTFKEACVVRNSWIKRYWKEWHETVTETFEDLSPEEVVLYLEKIDEEDIVAINLEEDVDTKLSKGDITYRVAKEGVIVEYVPFEQILVDPAATSVPSANYLAHRVRKSKDELLEMGFDQQVVEELPTNTVELTEGVIESARVISADDVKNVGDDRADRVWLYENYLRTSVPNGELEILQIFTVNDQILEINRVNEIPFETFTPFPVPGSIYGESITDITKDIQDLNSFLIRGVIENTLNANHQRYTGLKGQYDRRSLLDNRPGGVVEVNTMGAINPFPYHALPQGVFNLLEITEQKKEARTGVTRLSQGLDANVLKNDNAFATVNTMLTAAQSRLRMVARNFAEEGMKNLMLSVYQLIRENGKQPVVIETAKGQVTIIPSQLPVRDKMIVAVAVGVNERQERAQALSSALQVFTSTPALSNFMQPQNAYYLGTQLLQAMGIYDVQNYMTPMEQLPPPPPPSPAEEMGLQTMAETIKRTQAETQKILSEITAAQSKLVFEQNKAADDHIMKREESLSRQDEQADKMSIEERKLVLQEQEVQIKAQALELKRQEILIEAQLEATQKRSVGLGKS